MISVCMTTYNGEKYIEEQLNSILSQLSKCDELIISDDGSTDNTCLIIRNINDNRIKLYFNEGAHGFTHNFENALIYAKGDFIFLSDQDDIWKNNKVEETLKVLKHCDFTISDCITVDNEMNVLQISRFQSFNIKPGFIRHLIKSRYLGCCMAFKKNVLNASLPFPKNDFLIEHDIWLAAIAFLYFRVELINEPLLLYRRHGKNVSTGGFTKGYSAKVKMEKRIYRLIKLIRLYPKVYRIKKLTRE